MRSTGNDTESFLRSRIRSIADYPKQGILFRDITPLLKDKRAFSLCISELVHMAGSIKADMILGMEARGFIIGSAVAYAMGLGFVPARKKGKLPYNTIKKEYNLEYGSETLEVHEDSISEGENILIVDDLLATGGTALAAGELVKSAGGHIAGYLFVIELESLKGRARLRESSENVLSLLKY